MFNAHQLTSSRALEMLESGEMSDCVIEVQEVQNGDQNKKEVTTKELIAKGRSEHHQQQICGKNGGGDNGDGESKMAVELLDSDINKNDIGFEECEVQSPTQIVSIDQQNLSEQNAQLKMKEELAEAMEIEEHENRMKIQLPLENWVDLFGFVPRRQLVELLPQIDDRHFSEALQYFLQKVGKITLGYLEILPPKGNDTNGGPMVKKGRERLDLANTQMPENIKNFGLIHLSYLDISVVNFLRHFQQNSLLQNVNLRLWTTSNEKLLPFLTHVLPLIESIESIRMLGIPRLNKNSDSPPAQNNNEFNQSLNSMMAQPRILQIRTYGSDLKPEELDWFCKWLYNTPRNDGRPRLLIFSAIYCFSFIVDRIKQDFVSAIYPISFFICIYVPNNFQWPQDISLENGRTNEKMVVRKMQTADGSQMLISRHPHEASKQWIEQNEKEILDFDFEEQNRKISCNINK